MGCRHTSNRGALFPCHSCDCRVFRSVLPGGKGDASRSIAADSGKAAASGASRTSIGDQFASYAGTVPAPKAPAGPIFADPAPGKSYIQMAAVEKGVAAVFAEGLRAHDLTAFVAPGPSPNIFRVLIGPVSDPQAYKATKQELDKIGLSTFMRQYEK